MLTRTEAEARPAGAARAHWPELVLAAWTLFVWLGRIRNVIEDDTLAGWPQAWRLGLSTVFVVGAVAVLASFGWLVRRFSTGLLVATATALAVFGIIVWSIRGVDIALGDHSAGFIAVHTVLAVMTIGLGVLVLLRARRGHESAGAPLT